MLVMNAAHYQWQTLAVEAKSNLFLISLLLKKVQHDYYPIIISILHNLFLFWFFFSFSLEFHANQSKFIFFGEYRTNRWSFRKTLKPILGQRHWLITDQKISLKVQQTLIIICIQYFSSVVTRYMVSQR